MAHFYVLFLYIWFVLLCLFERFIVFFNYRFLQPELDRMGNEEALLQEKNMEFERKIALLGHELREAQRKSQYEAEMRQKAESANQDLKEKLQSEKDVIQKISSNSHQSNERISQLQKLVSDLGNINMTI